MTTHEEKVSWDDIEKESQDYYKSKGNELEAFKAGLERAGYVGEAKSWVNDAINIIDVLKVTMLKDDSKLLNDVSYLLEEVINIFEANKK